MTVDTEFSLCDVYVKVNCRTERFNQCFSFRSRPSANDRSSITHSKCQNQVRSARSVPQYFSFLYFPTRETRSIRVFIDVCTFLSHFLVHLPALPPALNRLYFRFYSVLMAVSWMVTAPHVLTYILRISLTE